MPEKKKGVVPPLRFPEFRDAGEWEVKQLGEVAAIFDGDWIESKDQSDSGIRLIQTGNIGVGEFIDKQDKSRFISKETFRLLKCREVFLGECIISRLPDPIGRACLLPETGCRMIVAVDCAIVRFVKNKVIPYYFILLSQTKQYLYEVDSCGSGSTRKRISRENLKKIKLPFPTFPEQQKIADCLSSLDEVIDLEAQKLEALKAHKKGLMQQLFPREGETTPSLRFPEFRDAGEWERKNGDVVFQQMINKKHNSDLPVLAITQEHGAIPRNLIDYHVSVSQESLNSYKVVEPGDFIISLRTFQGGIEYSRYKGICSPAYIVLRKRISIYDLFFKHYFKTDVFIKQLNKNVEGLRDGKMVSFKQFSELLLPYPPLLEQQKIADCLSSLDEVIDLQTQKLDALKAHKKGLMQQLFPSEVD